MKFANPEAFFLFVPLLLVAIYAWRVGVKKRARVFFPSGTWVDQRPRFRLISPFRLHFLLRVLELSLVIVALARPQKVFEKTHRLVEAVDIVICFDLSRSMDAIDLKPNRHIVALNTISQFIDQRPDDRIGLVLFAGEAYLAVPTTTDHDLLRKALMESSPRNLQDGTAIGQALAIAAYHLKDSTAKSRLIVLVTDGDNNMGSVDPMTATDLGKAYGIKIYTIGLGKKGRVPYPVKSRDIFGNEVTEYNYLTDAVNDELLQNIAQHTGGKSYHADENGMLEKIFANINELEKSKVETQTFVRYSEIAWPWILLALLLLLGEGLALNTRWRKVP